MSHVMLVMDFIYVVLRLDLNLVARHLCIGYVRLCDEQCDCKLVVELHLCKIILLACVGLYLCDDVLFLFVYWVIYICHICIIVLLPHTLLHPTNSYT